MEPLAHIGFIGLGIMGTPMALNLLGAGYPVTVWARRPDALTAVVRAGARAATIPRLVASQSDVVILMVSDTPDVTAMVSALEPGMRPGHVLIDMSTIAPSRTRELAQRLAQNGIQMLDAPVSGGQIGAQNGTLSIMVGGPLEVLDRVRPILAKLGTTIVHVGDHGAGQVAKACNQLLVAQTLIAVAEAIRFAEANGVDATRVRGALLGGFAQSRVLDVHGLRMINHDYAPGFKLSLHQKDLAIVAEEIEKLGLNLPGTRLAHSLFGHIVDEQMRQLDSSVIFQDIGQAHSPR